MMGQPSATEPWGWQLGGHHLVINYFVLGDQVVMTPLFLGGEPAVTTTGRYAGNAIPQAEQNEGLAFMRALDESQQRAATLAREKMRDDLQAGMLQDNLVLPSQGVRVDGLSPALKSRLRALIALYVGNMREDQGRVRMQDLDARTTVLQRHFGRKIGVPAYALASYVGASRIQAKRHYFSDVAFGAALGIVAGRSVTVGRGDGRFAVAPMAGPGGGGVGFTWIGNKGE